MRLDHLLSKETSKVNNFCNVLWSEQSAREFRKVSLFNLEGAGDEDCEKKIARGYSSAGRAPALQAGGRRFDPDYLHHLSSYGSVAQLARAYD